MGDVKIKERGRPRVWAMIFLLFFSLPAQGQDNTARLTGIVQSVSGSGLAGATLILRNLSSGSERTVLTNSEGHYEARGLAPGDYQVTVSLSGFLTQVRSGLGLAGGQTRETDFRLERGKGGLTTGETSPSQVPSASAGSGLIDEAQLVGLPLNGRSYTQLATLAGGVSDPFGGGKQSSGSGGMTVSGGRRDWNSFLLDGTDINGTDNQVPQSAAGGQLGADAVLQVQVFSTNYGAQHGRAAGGVMNAITRSGSNDWHGTAFEFFRNSKLDARNFFDSGSEPPPFKRNQFGGTLTGPVVKDNAFFMVSFEALRNRLTETYVSIVPDNEVRRGTLALPGRTIRVDPRVLPYLALYPLAERPLGGGIAENRAGVSLPTNEYFFVARLDQRLRDQDAWFLRYTFDDASTRTVAVDDHSPSFPARSESRQQYLTWTETHFFSPTLLNTLRISYTRPVTRTASAPTVEIPPPLYFVPGAPEFGRITVPGLTTFGPLVNSPSAKTMNSFQFADDLLRSRGSHTLRLGMLVERFQWNVFDHPNAGGEWSFSSLASFLQAGPEASTDLRVALPGSVSERAYRQTLFAFYAQDEYKVRPNFDLNLGLRYEFTTMIHDAKGRDVFLRDELRDTAPEVGPFMSKNPSLRSLAPRIGLSWSPGSSSQTVVRAGFGMYFDQIIEYSVDAKKSTIPFFRLAVRPNFISAPTFPDAVASAGVAARQIRVFEYNNPKIPTVYRYHLTIERQILPGLKAQATYVGARGNHLLRRFEANLYPFPVRQSDGTLFFPPNQGPMNPAFSSIERTTTDAQSFYNSLILSLSRNLWNVLSLDANYTYSKSVDDASSLSQATPHYALIRTLNRSLSWFDVRHRLSLNYFYSLPLGSGRRWLDSSWLSEVFGGWRVGGILSVRTGLSVDPSYKIASPGFLFVAQKPNLIAGRDKNPVTGVAAGCLGIPAGEKLGNPDRYFDPCAYSAPPPGTIGNAGRNTIVGPQVVSLDLSLQKDFALDSKRKLQFRAEFFNLPNHSNFREPDDSSAAIFADAQGRYNPSAGKLNATASNSRQIQFALRFSF